jgi:DNA-binding CsgD family transcriptional regulator
VDDVVGWGAAASYVVAASWNLERWRALNDRHVQLIRDAGALAELPTRLMASGLAATWVGDLAGAASAIAESDSVAAATGGSVRPWALLRLRAMQGREVDVSALTAAVAEPATPPGEGMLASHALWAAAVLNNGLERYADAATAARAATSNPFEPWISMWALPELIEAAARLEDVGTARDAFERLEPTTRASGGDAALGIESRCRALLEDGETADRLYREAVERLARTQLRPELARAHLLYGEWLGGEGRRDDAREQLRTAHAMFASIGMEAFAERARRELIARGERMHKPSREAHDELTPQEEQIARLARSGLSNPEIGAQLFLSPRTVEWHLRKVFAKLGISSRNELRTALTVPGHNADHVV